MLDLASLTHETFLPYVGQAFTATLPGRPEAGQVELRLLDATPMERYRSPKLRRTPFSLRFQSQEREQHLPQSTYRIENPEFGYMDVFVVPIEKLETGYVYQIAFT